MSASQPACQPSTHLSHAAAASESPSGGTRSSSRIRTRVETSRIAELSAVLALKWLLSPPGVSFRRASCSRSACGSLQQLVCSGASWEVVSTGWSGVSLK
jgi:hypothetical protein